MDFSTIGEIILLLIVLVGVALFARWDWNRTKPRGERIFSLTFKKGETKEFSANSDQNNLYCVAVKDVGSGGALISLSQKGKVIWEKIVGLCMLPFYIDVLPGSQQPYQEIPGTGLIMKLRGVSELSEGKYAEIEVRAV